MNAAPIGTVTLLFTDIEGSTRLLRQVGEAYGDLLLAHRRLLREAFGAHRGYEVDAEGDAFFVAFASAREAVAATRAAQRALAAYEWPEGERIWVRMGLHTGEPRLFDGRYIGLDVHHAARVMAAGHGGQVLLSQSTRDLLDEQFSLRDLGEHRLKDLSSGQRLYQLQIEGLPGDFPALKTLENRPTNLPVQPTPLIGRGRELDEVVALLGRSEVRMVTLTGPGGTGKTRLALQAAANLLEEFSEGVFFVSLAPVRDPDLLVPTIAQTLGVREQVGESLLDTVGNYLRDKTMLLLLDNLEQISEAAPEIAALLRVAPKLKVLGTSRAPLRLSGEHLYPVPPLALPDLDHLPDHDKLARYEAVHLFITCAEKARPDFSVTAENAPAIAEICVRLDGLPLAIELGAARVGVLSPQAILTRLDQRLKLLTGGAQDLDERQRTLRATIEWSYDLLPEQERILFARLGVFVGGCRVEAAEAVCDPERDLGIGVFDGLASLVEKSLLRQRDDSDGEPRFWMLETIREYALGRIGSIAEGDQLRSRLAGWFLVLAQAAEPELRRAGQATWLRRLESEHDNLRAALDWARTTKDGESLAGLASALWYFWWSHAHVREGRMWLDEALAMPGISSGARARALYAASSLADIQADYDKSELFLEECLPLFRTMGDLKGVADSLTGFASNAMARGKLPEAEAFALEAVTVARELGADVVIAGALNDLGNVYSELGDYEQAIRHHEECLALRRGVGGDGLIANSLLNLGALALFQGDHSRAEPNLQEGLALGLKVGEKRFIASGLVNLGWLALSQGEDEVASGRFKESLPLLDELGDRRGLAEVFFGLAAVTAAQTAWGRSATLAGAGEQLLTAIGSPRSTLETHALKEVEKNALANIGHGPYSEFFDQGRSMPLEIAVDYARSSDDTRFI